MKTLFIVLFFAFSFYSCAQTDNNFKKNLYEEFKKDFEVALNDDFSESQLNKMFRDYSQLLTPHGSTTKLVAGLKGETVPYYPLEDFRNDKLYKNNINDLFYSENSYHRILSYLVIASSGNMSFEDGLLEKIKTETKKGNLLWAGMALLHLKTNHTTELFDFLVEHENFGDTHMIPLYFKLNKDSLQATAYNRIDSEKVKAKILAAQIFSVTPKNDKTEKLLLEAVKNWEYRIKGYAIYSVKTLKMGNLLESFKPLLDSSQIRSIAIEALANSPTKEDTDYLKQLVANQDTVSEELLDGFYKSNNSDNIRFWLLTLRSKSTPEDYFFSASDQPLLYSDELLEEVKLTLKECKNEEVIGNLVRALEGRNDDESIDLLVKLLKHNNSTVRYWTGSVLTNNKSERIINEAIDLIKSTEYRTSILTTILIKNNIDTLQSTFEAIYLDNSGLDWTRSSVTYLSTFPLDRHKEIFRAILVDKDEDFFVKRQATLGLGKLKDKNSVSLIIQVCKEECEGSDYNAQTFLHALAMIKGKEAKNYIKSFRNSNEEHVQMLVEKLLKEW